MTELGLNVKKARISSDGGWFVDGKQRWHGTACILTAPPSCLSAINPVIILSMTTQPITKTKTKTTHIIAIAITSMSC